MKQALLIIDAQQELMEGNEEQKPIYEKKRLIQTINNVIEEAVKQEIPVLFVRDEDVADGEGDGFQVHREIHVPAGAPMFNKQATNAFYGTNLLRYLQEIEVGHLVMMGCQTEYCIDTAVRTATVNGFDVTLVEDGHSTTDAADLSAKQIIAHHNRILHGHYNVDNFSIVRNSEETLFEPTHDHYR